MSVWGPNWWRRALKKRFSEGLRLVFVRRQTIGVTRDGMSGEVVARRRQILGTFAMSEPQGLVALPLDPGSYLANTSGLTLALV